MFQRGSLEGEEMCASISIVDDDDSERVEELSVVISSNNEEAGVVNDSAVRVSIFDDDGK